jgi:hypothetical protein
MAMTRNPAATAALMPLVESSIATHREGSTWEPAGGFQVDIGGRLAARHLLGGEDDFEECSQAGAVEDHVDQLTGR